MAYHDDAVVYDMTCVKYRQPEYYLEATHLARFSELSLVCDM
jgi:hypothetical protein